MARSVPYSVARALWAHRMDTESKNRQDAVSARMVQAYVGASGTERAHDWRDGCARMALHMGVEDGQVTSEEVRILQ